MTFALPSSPHWAPTTTVTGMRDAPSGYGRNIGESYPIPESLRPVLRSTTWRAMSEADRAALCDRGLQAIFDADLKAAIGMILDDVRANGDEAVCRALRNFDRVVVEPHQLRASAEEFASARVPAEVDHAIDDAI